MQIYTKTHCFLFFLKIISYFLYYFGSVSNTFFPSTKKRKRKNKNLFKLLLQILDIIVLLIKQIAFNWISLPSNVQITSLLSLEKFYFSKYLMHQTQNMQFENSHINSYKSYNILNMVVHTFNKNNK